MTKVRFTVPLCELDKAILEFAGSECLCVGFETPDHLDAEDALSRGSDLPATAGNEAESDAQSLKDIFAALDFVDLDKLLAEISKSEGTMNDDDDDDDDDDKGDDKSENENDNNIDPYSDGIFNKSFVQSIFAEWDWGRKLRDYLSELTERDEDDEDLGFDLETDYQEVLRMVSSRDESSYKHRVIALKALNSDFVQRLQDVSGSTATIHFTIKEDDAFYWLIWKLMKTPQSSLLLKTGQVAEFLDWGISIWKLWYLFRITWRCPENQKLITALFKSVHFKEHYRIERCSVEKSPFGYTIKDKHLLKAFEDRLERRNKGDITRYGSGLRWLDPTKEGEKELATALDDLRLKGEYERILLQNPAIYLEYIQWSDLRSVSEDEFKSINLAAEPLYMSCGIENHKEWCLWSPQTSSPLDSHLFYSEEEIFQHCVIKNWYLPGHILGDSVVFKRTELERTKFVEDLKNFWKHWNDCAITQDPETNQLYLLETLPGRKFRQVKDLQGIRSAKMFFRYLVEENVSQDSPKLLSEVLGENYHPKYEKLLRLIPESQIHSISENPIAAGLNGSVYKAVLRENDWYLECMKAGQRERNIVLKSIKPEYQSKRLAKFIHELDATYSALVGIRTKSIQFHGITRLSASQISGSDTTISSYNDGSKFGRDSIGDSTSDKMDESPNQELYLVFDYATLGNLRDYLIMRFQSPEIGTVKSWRLVLKVMYSTAGGLSEIHKRGIIHRDLHLGNILVTEVPNGDEFNIKISDLGESKVINDDSDPAATGNITVGSLRSQPSEFLREGRWTTAADIYRFGRIILEIVELHSHFVADAPKSGGISLVPRVLKEAKDQCFNADLALCPTAENLAFKLEEFAWPEHEEVDDLELTEFGCGNEVTHTEASSSSSRDWMDSTS